MAENKLITLLESVVNKLKNMSAETKLAEAVLTDGSTVVSAGEDFVAGAEIFLINEAGEQVPAPVGTHETESGAVIVVETEGVIASFTAPSAEEEEMNEEGKKKEEEMSLTLSQAKELFAEMFASEMEKLSKPIDALTAQVTALSKPAARSIKKENADAKKKEMSKFQEIRSKYSKV